MIPPLWQEIQQHFPHLSLSLQTGERTGWRTRVKLAIRGTSTNPLIGLFRPGTHVVEPLEDCVDHHSSINQALHLLRKALITCKVPPYSEQTGQGLLRYCQLALERSTSQIQLTLVATRCDPLIDALFAHLQEKSSWHSLWLNLQPLVSNTIFGNRWKKISGEEFLHQRIIDTSLFFHPACFCQANLPLFEKLLTSLKSQIPEGAHIVEYYAGVGSIGLTMASKAKELTCIEENPYCGPCFALAKEKIPYSFPIHFHTSAADDALSFLESADVLIVDPPRKGLSSTLIKALSSSRELFYISCNFTSFLCNLKELEKQGWKLHSLEGYLFFPGTNHVELLAHIRKN